MLHVGDVWQRWSVRVVGFSLTGPDDKDGQLIREVCHAARVGSLCHVRFRKSRASGTRRWGLRYALVEVGE